MDNKKARGIPDF